jgi:hypothetical protein
LPEGAEVDAPTSSLATAEPTGVATVKALVKEIEAALIEERRRMEDRLASNRAWPEATWRARFVEHPIGGLFGRRLVWSVGAPAGPAAAGLPTEYGWVDEDGRAHPPGAGDAVVRLWHPVEATEAEVMAWRGSLATRAVEQPIRQVEREVFRPLARDRNLAVDRRFSGRIVDHGRLRGLLRQRGWAAPFVGSWDQGEEATAWRTFDDGLRAELRYQALEHLATAERHERVRLVAVRFVRAQAATQAAPAADVALVRLDLIAPRIFSEAIRDVNLVVAVAGASRAS